MKRTPWISWRLYFFTIPINLVITILASDHILIGRRRVRFDSLLIRNGEKGTRLDG